jgi:hypothetical protein
MIKIALKPDRPFVIGQLGDLVGPGTGDPHHRGSPEIVFNAFPWLPTAKVASIGSPGKIFHLREMDPVAMIAAARFIGINDVVPVSIEAELGA